MKPSIIKRKVAALFVKYYTIVLIVLVLVILGAGYSLLIQDTLREINEIGVENLQDKEAKLAQSKETIIRLKSLNDRYAKVMYEDVKMLSDVLPSQSEIPNLIIELQEFIKSNDLSLHDIQVGSLSTATISEVTAAAPVINSLNITVIISQLDSYDGLKLFLDDLSTNLPLVELNSLNYTPGIDAYSLNLTTYYK